MRPISQSNATNATVFPSYPISIQPINGIPESLETDKNEYKIHKPLLTCESATAHLPMMVSVLGPPQLKFQARNIPIRGNKSQAILTHLALAYPHAIPRADLLEWIWPQEEIETAGQSLNSFVSELNKLCRKARPNIRLIQYECGYYRLHVGAGIGTDLEQFDRWRTEGSRLLQMSTMIDEYRMVPHPTQKHGIVHCKQALAFYRGELSGDSTIRTMMERERLRIAFFDLLTQIANYYHAHGDFEQTLIYLQRLLKEEPCNEAAHRQMMNCYVQMGQRTYAMRQYKICVRALASEFDAQPENATVELFNKIRTNS